MLFSIRLKNAFFLSLAGHIALFGVFNLSFGHKISKASFNEVSFLGSILRSDFMRSRSLLSSFTKNEFIVRKAEISQLGNASASIDTLGNTYYLKPQISAAFNNDKAIFHTSWDNKPAVRERKKPVITFYPLLPSQFSLYFKDRQVAHIELMFNIMSEQGRSSIVVKRKISSGNLEADLLSMRYISRYLFMQQGSFSHNKWQAVKIDLSQKEND